MFPPGPESIAMDLAVDPTAPPLNPKRARMAFRGTGLGDET